MRKRVQKSTRSGAIVKDAKTAGIQPFLERPGDDKYENAGKKKAGLDAADLFAHFTADVMKEQVLFTR